MPRLYHLALDTIFEDWRQIRNIFATLLPTVNTLAISGFPDSERDFEFFQALSTLPNLTHLSMNSSSTEQFFDCVTANGPTALRLDSPHLNAITLLGGAEVRGKLAMILRGRKENGNIKRVVMYGSKEGFAKMTDLSDLEDYDLEWRADRLPFADFDGK